MTDKPGLLAELKRRNVWRAAAVYIAAAWAISQGIAQLGPLFHAPEWAMRWFVIACAIGFPFWIAFAWFYAWTPQGFKREEDVAHNPALAHSTGRKLDFWIIGILAVAVVLLGSGYLIHRHAPAAAPVAAAATIPGKSIAVLPFQNLSDDPKNSYFVQGMQELILTKLADIGSLKVIARASTEKYASHTEDLKTIGRQLGVATVLEGSVQKQGNEVLINVQLLDCSTNAHIWAEDYTRTLTNVFGVEGDVAQKIAAALKAKLSPADTARLASNMSTDLSANNFFLRAEYLANQASINYITGSGLSDWKAAIPLYQQAVKADPGFALAWARLSYAESRLAWFGGAGMDIQQLKTQARADAGRAVQLAPGLAAAQLALGYTDYYGRSDYPAALEAFAAALKLKPSDADALAAQGYVQRRQIRFDAAIDSLTQALAIDPRNSTLAYELGVTALMASRFPEAEQAFQHALALDPHNLNAQGMYPYSILYASGDIAKALAAAQGDSVTEQFARVTLLTYQRRYAEALAQLNGIPDTPSNFLPVIGVSKVMGQADLYRLMGDTATARALYAKDLPKARAAIDPRQKQGYQGEEWQRVADDELGLGATAEGLASIAKAQTLVDNDKASAVDVAPYATENTANLYAKAGRPDLAVPLLAKALAMPGIGNSYAPVLLWLDPAWDPIRHAPAFQAPLKKYAKYKPAVIPAPAFAGSTP